MQWQYHRPQNHQFPLRLYYQNSDLIIWKLWDTQPIHCLKQGILDIYIAYELTDNIQTFTTWGHTVRIILHMKSFLLCTSCTNSHPKVSVWQHNTHAGLSVKLLRQDTLCCISKARAAHCWTKIMWFLWSVASIRIFQKRVLCPFILCVLTVSVGDKWIKCIILWGNKINHDCFSFCFKSKLILVRSWFSVVLKLQCIHHIFIISVTKYVCSRNISISLTFITIVCVFMYVCPILHYIIYYSLYNTTSLYYTCVFMYFFVF